MKTDMTPGPDVAERPAQARSTAFGDTDRRPRLAVLIRRWDARGGGAERYAIELTRRLSARYAVHVFAQDVSADAPGGSALGPVGPGRSSDPTREACGTGRHGSDDIVVHRVGWALKRPRWLNQLLFAVRTWWLTRRGFDVVHSHEMTWHGQVQTVHVLPVRFNLWSTQRALSKLYNAMRILTSPRLLSYWALEAARMAPRPGRVVVLSAAALQASVQAAYPRSAPRVVIPPGVATSPSSGPAPEAHRLALRARLGWWPDAWVWLFVANDARRKGLDTVLQALALCEPDVCLVVVGDGRDHADYAEQVRVAGLTARVHFSGAMNPVAPAYQAADVLVHPTREDTYAMVVLEAQAAGLPTVISPAPWCGIAAELRDGHDTLVLPAPDDAQALAQATQRVRNDPGLRRELIQAGLAHALACDWDTRARAQDEVYQQVIAARQRR